MTVQELIDALSTVQDKSIPVNVTMEMGRSYCGGPVQGVSDDGDVFNISSFSEWDE